jgi:hypothetical protein
MKMILIIAMMMLSGISYGQESNKEENSKPMAFAKVTPEQKFEYDSNRSSFTIYTVGGLKPYNHETTEAFQKKFNISYHDFGCIAPVSMTFFETYNLLVFQHLQKQYGNDWQKDIRDNAIGINKWKERNK